MSNVQQTPAAAHSSPETASRSRSWCASAPGRVNLIGEHTDYNQGYSLPMAIDRYTTINAELIESSEWLSFHSDKFPRSVNYTRDGAQCITQDPAPVWSKYVAGVVSELSKIGFQLPALQIHIASNVPLGAGVASSASVEVAMALLIQKIANRSLTPLETAILCQAAEHQHVGVPCGLMDQMSSVSGIADHLMLLDFRSNSIEQIFLPAELAVIVVNSRVKHRLADGQYRQRREQCATACRLLGVDALREVTMDVLQRYQETIPELIFRRARHVVTENSRTVEAASRILSRQWQAVGELMYLSHESMRDDFEISTPEIDSLVEIARALGDQAGVFGSRLTGGGFGGCTITLALAERADSILQGIVERYHRMTGIQIDGFVTRPADGALAVAKNLNQNRVPSN